jgi:hypothetical protein
MTQVHRNSNVITNAVATPRVPNSPCIGGPGQMFEVCGLITNAADDSSGSIHRFCRVPSNARISQVLFTTLLATTAGNIDIGVYQTAENGGTVVDADLFASAIAITTPDSLNLDVTHESGQYSVIESMKPLWEVIGLSADPCREYDIAATITTTYNTATTSQVLKVRYVI